MASQNTWLNSMPKTQLVLKPPVPTQKDLEKEQQVRYEKQQAIWAREGVFWCKDTETLEIRREGCQTQPVSGHWFHNRTKKVLELYSDIQQAPVETREVVFFKTPAKRSGQLGLQRGEGRRF
jgi:hypothetical protein